MSRPVYAANHDNKKEKHFGGCFSFLLRLPSEFVAIGEEIIERRRVVVARGVTGDVLAIQDIVDREQDIAFGIRRVLRAEGRQEIRLLVVGMRRARAHDAIGEIGEVEGCAPFSFFIGDAAIQEEAAEGAIPVSLGRCFLRCLLGFRVLPCEAGMPGETVSLLAADGNLEALIAEIFIDGVPDTAGFGEGNIIFDFFGEESNFVLPIFRFHFPAEFVMRAFFGLEIRIADDAAGIGAGFGIHLREGRQGKGLGEGGVEALRVGEFVQVLHLAA